MIITDIIPQKRNDKYFNIYIDGEYVFALSDVDILFYKVSINSQISKEKFDLIYEEVVFSKAKSTAFVYIGYSARTKKEVFDKLSKDFPEDAVTKTVSLLEKYGYINDEDYTKKFISDKTRLKNWGKQKIFFELKRKGITEEILSEVFENTDFGEESSIQKLISKKIKNNQDIDFKEKQKLFRYLASKGFDFETITLEIKKFFQDFD